MDDRVAPSLQAERRKGMAAITGASLVAAGLWFAIRFHAPVPSTWARLRGRA